MQTVTENLGLVLNTVAMLVQLAFIAALCLIAVRALRVLMGILEKLTEEASRWQLPPTSYTATVSTSMPSQAHPTQGPTTTTATAADPAPVPPDALKVTCKNCHAPNWLTPIRSEVKGDRTILKFMCPDCDKEFGKLA